MAVSITARARQAAPAAAVALGLLTIGAGLSRVPLDQLTHQVAGGHSLAEDWLTATAFVTSGAVVGTLVAARRPGNPLGWLLLAFFLYSGTPASDYAYLDYGMHHGTLPLGMVAVVLAAAWPVWLVLIAVMLWLFPDGRLPAGRWRRVAVALVAAGVLLALVASAGNVVAIAGRAVPVSASGSFAANAAGAWAVVLDVLVALILASWAAWLVLQVPAYRRSAGERRQQLKWLYSGAVVLVVSALISALASGDSASPWQLIGALGLAVLPVCIGVAVLRYRLYAIDRIISRVISYAVITAVLAGVFAGLVILATGVLPVRTPVAVAVATLAAAALFNPLRSRVQHLVDRRFNRSRYDADQAISAFAARLSGATDLDTVHRDLLAAVQTVLEPAHASIWLAEPR